MTVHKGIKVNCVMFSTSLLEPRLRTLAYSKWIHPIADLHPINDEPIEASIALYELGQMTIARSSSSAARYVRDQDVISRGVFDDCILIRFVRRGTVLGNFGDAMNVEANEGDIYISDLSQPIDIRTDDTQHLNLLVPKKALDNSGQQIHGRLLQCGRLPCRIFSQHLFHLFEAAASLDKTSALAFSQFTLGVLRKCLGISHREQGAQMRARALQERILAHIESRLTDPELGAGTLQKKFHISRTHLYRLFEDIGGIQRCIRERRLQTALRMLCANDGRSISEVSLGLGFTNERQFQRAFRARFGMTAGSVRNGLFELSDTTLAPLRGHTCCRR